MSDSETAFRIWCCSWYLNQTPFPFLPQDPVKLVEVVTDAVTELAQELGVVQVPDVELVERSGRPIRLRL